MVIGVNFSLFIFHNFTISQFLDDAVAEQHRAAVFDAELSGHVLGAVAVGHEVEGAAFVWREEGGKGVDGVAQVAVVRFGDGVGHAVIERQELVCAPPIGEMREHAAAVQYDPCPLLKHVGLLAQRREIIPQRDIALLPQLGTAACVAPRMPHTEPLDERPMPCYHAVVLVV